MAKLLSADGAWAGDQFGFSVAVSGSTAIIGAPYADNAFPLGLGSGSAYVFQRIAGTWTQAAKLNAADGARADNFGNSVALSGLTAVIGARYGNGLVAGSGTAYWFWKAGGVWMQVGKLNASNGTGNDRFGGSVAFSGNTAVIGAARNDDLGSNSGSAYVFLDCDDGNSCTSDRHVDAGCIRELIFYGDVDHDRDVDIFDLFCILNGFSGDFSVCSFNDDDLEPCAGDGDIDLFDLFAVVNAFSGIDPCCGGLP